MVPAEQDADQAGLAGTRGADNGHVTSFLQAQLDILKNYVARNADADAVKIDRHAVCDGLSHSLRYGCRPWPRNSRRVGVSFAGMRSLRLAPLTERELLRVSIHRRGAVGGGVG